MHLDKEPGNAGVRIEIDGTIDVLLGCRLGDSKGDHTIEGQDVCSGDTPRDAGAVLLDADSRRSGHLVRGVAIHVAPGHGLREVQVSYCVVREHGFTPG